jgi:hypothetical protein
VTGKRDLSSWRAATSRLPVCCHRDVFRPFSPDLLRLACTDTAKATLDGAAHVVPVVDEVVTEASSDAILGDAVKQLPARFGEFGGQYVPEALFDCLVELEAVHSHAINDPTFWEEFESYYGYINRPSGLYEATRLTEYAGGAKIWFKREDLNHTGSHKINNAMGQVCPCLPNWLRESMLIHPRD